MRGRFEWAGRWPDALVDQVCVREGYRQGEPQRKPRNTKRPTPIVEWGVGRSVLPPAYVRAKEAATRSAGSGAQTTLFP